ncbi:NADH pyrophosphatase zinc ribbon domain-containing protein [Micromonospora noduli]|uniref:NADH pyrophosphatase zinc ribbon domain-containing protein n=1 Tax=Micromonospora noduli TaxID=709876 RepID=UPI000DC3E0A6|nr:NADH pyrophosphatase zinc ribbon domain-containing protein [Micromonospora noduli]RAO18827.1 NAD(+) diphosphatase [Micromonospora noduli]
MTDRPDEPPTVAPPGGHATLAGRALAVLTWRRTHRWCGACRAELTDRPGETARQCPDCGLYVPMQLSAAVLVAITRPGPPGHVDELLLVRHATGPTGLWALVAASSRPARHLRRAYSISRRLIDATVTAGRR